MTQTPPKATAHLAAPAARSWGSSIVPAIPYGVDLAGDPDPDHVHAIRGLLARGAEGLPAYVGLSTKYTITARRILRTSSSTAASWRRGQPSWRSTRRTSSRSHGPPTGTCTRTPGNRQAPCQDTADATAATKAFWPTIASFGLPYYLLVLEKVDDPQATRLPRSSATSGRPRSSAPSSKPGSCTRSTRASLRSSSRSPHATAPCASPRHHHAAHTGPDQGAHAGSDPAIDDERRPTTRLRQKDPAWLDALQAAKTSITVLGHLAGTRLSPAHRHGRDADDHVQPSSRRPRAPAVARASVAASHRFRFRPAHDPVSEDLPTHAGQRPPCARQAPRPVR